MQKLRVALISMIVFVALASWYKSQRLERAAAPSADSGEMSPAIPPTQQDASLAQTALAQPTPSTTGEGVAAAPAPRSIDTKNQTLIRECLAKSPALPRVNVTDRTTLEDILHDLSVKPDSSKMTVHVKRGDGREERLLIQPHEETNKHSYKIDGDDLRVFDVDSEGLPIAKDFPGELKRDSLTHAVNAFIGDDRVTFKERRTHSTFEGGVATFVETDGVMTELQIVFGRTTLGCIWQNDALNCACL
jgi:hypothetical protein